LQANIQQPQLTDIYRIKKCSRREKERSRTQDVILVHPSSRVKSSPLQTGKYFH